MIHETQHDIDNENRIAAHVALLWKCEQVSRGPLEPIDRDFTRGGKLVALVEVRTRNNDIDKYDDFIVEKSKVEKLLEKSKEKGVPGFMVIEFDDVLAYFRPVESDLQHTRLCSRRVPRDKNDIGDVVCVIQLDRFKELARGT